jgi:hypothetical protein
VEGKVNPTKRYRYLPAQAAAELIADRYAICRTKPNEKRPTYPRWTLASIDPDDIGPDDGIGIVCGPLSGPDECATTCIDLDNPDALPLADQYLPATGMVEGRKGKQQSHRWYTVPLTSIPAEHHSHAIQSAPVMLREYYHPGPRTTSFRDAQGKEIVRLIGTGGQAVVPPSMHESGERREWVGGRRGEPARVDFVALLTATRELARACGWAPKVSAVASAAANASTTTRTVSPHLDFRLRYRINRYVDSLPPAVAGSGGHDATYFAACALVWGFMLDEADAIKFLRRFNARCEPQWSEQELRHKVREAANAFGHRKPYGHLV